MSMQANPTSDGSRLGGRNVVVAAVILFWLLAGLAEVATLYSDPSIPRDRLTWHVWAKRGVLAIFWIAVTLLALHFYERFPVVVGNLRRHLLVAGVAAVLVTLAYLALFGLIVMAMSDSPIAWWDGVRLVLTFELIYQYFKVWQVVAAVNAYLHLRRTMQRERREQQLRLRLVETELMVFRAQLEPHFLFNTLNSIASLVRLNSTRLAVDAISQLASLLRNVLDLGQRQYMPWRWELAFTRGYVALQQLRYGERLEVAFDADGIPSERLVPALLLQPLIENAIHHGPLDDGEACSIHVLARSTRDGIHLRVANPVGRGEAHASHGIGLANVRARLLALYQGMARVDTTCIEGRFVAVLTLPDAELSAKKID